MPQVIVERPRFGATRRMSRACRRSARHVAILDPELAPVRQGMRRPYLERGMAKSLNEYLQPLWRFLLARVGRPWDEVYSEIAGRLRGRSAVQHHVLQHLWEFVATDVFMIDGAPHRISTFHGGLQPIRFGYYVDPIDGRLLGTGRRDKWSGYWAGWSKPVRAALPSGVRSEALWDIQYWCIRRDWFRVRLRPAGEAWLRTEFEQGQRLWQAWCGREPSSLEDTFERGFEHFRKVRVRELEDWFGSALVPVGAPQRVPPRQVIDWIRTERGRASTVWTRRTEAGWRVDSDTGWILKA